MCLRHFFFCWTNTIRNRTFQHVRKTGINIQHKKVDPILKCWCFDECNFFPPIVSIIFASVILYELLIFKKYFLPSLLFLFYKFFFVKKIGSCTTPTPLKCKHFYMDERASNLWCINVSVCEFLIHIWQKTALNRKKKRC